jgi:DNA repair exonuclease SbcCD ATPase subunit
MNGLGRVFSRPGGFAFWAGIACFCVVFAGIAMGEGEPAESEVAVSAAEEQTVTLGEEELAELTSGMSPEERADLLASGDDAALEAALDEANRRVEQLAEAMPTIHRDIREFRQKAMRDSDKAKEIRAQIQALEDELVAYADELPEVRGRRDALEAINRNLMDELRFRRELTRKLGRDISRAVPAEEPPILEP